MKYYAEFLKYFPSFKEKEEFNPFISIREVKMALTRRGRLEFSWSSISNSISLLDDIFESQDIIEVNSGYRYDTETNELSSNPFSAPSYIVSSPALSNPDIWFTSVYNDN